MLYVDKVNSGTPNGSPASRSAHLPNAQDCVAIPNQDFKEHFSSQGKVSMTCLRELAAHYVRAPNVVIFGPEQGRRLIKCVGCNDGIPKGPNESALIKHWIGQDDKYELMWRKQTQPLTVTSLRPV